jgi:putative acetyltransferase
MYFTADVRGAGLGSRLLEIILDAARQAGYTSCYLETIESMDKARQLYLKSGFESIKKPLGNTGHGSCNQFMIMDL